jgi:hypothetical protein
MQFQQCSGIEVPPAGGDGGCYENTSSCDDRSGFGYGVLGESERGTGCESAVEHKARAAANARNATEAGDRDESW